MGQGSSLVALLLGDLCLHSKRTCIRSASCVALSFDSHTPAANKTLELVAPRRRTVEGRQKEEARRHLEATDWQIAVQLECPLAETSCWLQNVCVGRYALTAWKHRLAANLRLSCFFEMGPCERKICVRSTTLAATQELRKQCSLARHTSCTFPLHSAFRFQTCMVLMLFQQAAFSCSGSIRRTWCEVGKVLSSCTFGCLSHSGCSRWTEDLIDWQIVNPLSCVVYEVTFWARPGSKPQLCPRRNSIAALHIIRPLV